MKPLLMMRAKGLTGPGITKHAQVPGISKAGGNYFGADMPGENILPFGSIVNVIDGVDNVIDGTDNVVHKE